MYMDNANGTRLLPEVLEEMMPCFTAHYGNPSSIHPGGVEPRKALELARERVAALIGASPEEIFFTSCGSESNNFAVKGAAWGSEKKGKHIVLSAVEHQSVLNSAKWLSKQGWEVTAVGVDKKGFVSPEDIAKALRDDTVLVSVVHASNEVGTFQNIKELSEIPRKKGITFHSDAIQTAGTIPVAVDEIGVDLLSLSANMFYGPKGAAALYIRKGTKILPFIHGGIQERGRRAGTENVPAIVGMGKAAEIALRDMQSRIEKTTSLRENLIRGLEEIPKVYLNGDREKRLPGNVHVSFEAVEGEAMLYSLAGKGILAASGSSCVDRALKSSHVLSAMGVDPALANGSVLFSLGFDNSTEETDFLLESLPSIIERLRAMSPLWNC